MKISAIGLTAVSFLLFGIVSSPGQSVSDEAKRHFNRGTAAVKMEDFEAAVKAFEQAARLAPTWADAVYNLGLAQEGANQYGDAVKSYREYLRLAPNASDSEEVKSLIDRLENKKNRESGIERVYDVMTYSLDPSVVPHVRWVRISKRGDSQPDWEIEYHDRDPRIRDYGESPLEGIFEKVDDSLRKSQWHSFIIHEGYALRPAGGDRQIRVDGSSFEYGYHVAAVFPSKIYADGRIASAIMSGLKRGELSIKGEILSVDDSIRIQRTQTLTITDVGTYVTEFIYELISVGGNANTRKVPR